MSGVPCRNGAACTRPGCWFAHPDGHSAGGSDRSSYGGPSGGRGQSGGSSVCRFGRSCHREGCYYSHPQGREIDEDAPPSGGISAGPGAQQRSQPAALPSAFNPDDFEDAEDQEDFLAAQASVQCECCGGNPMACATPSCRAMGRCGCILGEVDDDEEDDSLRDEWFPEFRNCPCCAGTIYRCQKQQPDCVSGNCFCSLQKQ